MGLEERSPAGDFFTGLGLFSIGVLAGAGLGLMFAPRRGDEMRQVLNEAWRNRGRAAQDFQRDLGAEGNVAPATGH
jgi:gas vesicle protein